MNSLPTSILFAVSGATIVTGSILDRRKERHSPGGLVLLSVCWGVMGLSQGWLNLQGTLAGGLTLASGLGLFAALCFLAASVIFALRRRTLRGAAPRGN